VTSLDSPEDNVGSTVDWRDVGSQRWTLHVQFARTSKNLLLASVFVAVMLDQLLWTTVGKCGNFLNSLKAMSWQLPLGYLVINTHTIVQKYINKIIDVTTDGQDDMRPPAPLQ